MKYLLLGTAISALLMLGLSDAQENGTPPPPPVSSISYDIVYVRSPRPGDTTPVKLPEIKDPFNIPPGTDLMLLHSDGSEEVLVAGGDGAIIDPMVSFDGRTVYFVRFHDVRPSQLNSQRRYMSRAGSDIYKIDVFTREETRLTFQEWTPNPGFANWSDNPLSGGTPDEAYLGYGMLNLGPTPLPGGKIMFTSSRDSFEANKGYTFPSLQLYVMDEDGKNVEKVGHLNLGSALHPNILMDGRVMFSSYESQATRDQRIWALWSIWPDGREFNTLFSGFRYGEAAHFQTQKSNGDIVVVMYYNQNNNGFGSLLAFPASKDPAQPPFGPYRPSENVGIQEGYYNYPTPNIWHYPFSPPGLYAPVPFSHPKDYAASKGPDGEYLGKVTHPSGAPGNDLLLVWTPGPANNLNRPVSLPRIDAGLYLLPDGVSAELPSDLVLIKNDPAYNELQPRALVSYEEIYGIAEPVMIPWLPNDGQERLPEATPFGLVGSSSLLHRDSFPGVGDADFDGLDPFQMTSAVSSNWIYQGADDGLYPEDEVFAIRIISEEPSTAKTYHGPSSRKWQNHGSERMRILGEVPVRKFLPNGDPVLDPLGQPDTSFLAMIPADTSFTFQTIDRRGMVLNMAQTWHQVRPGEERYNCGGCHAHSRLPLAFESTAAAQPGFSVADMATQTPLLMPDGTVQVSPERAVDVEYYRDIKPILERSCVGCHSVNGPMEGQLALDDETQIDGYDATYMRLANDPNAQWGYPPVLPKWYFTNASRYIKKFQPRRSLLMWKLWGERLDGWTNEDHPTESVPGDASTLPPGASTRDADLDYTGTIMPPPNSGYPEVTDEEKMLFARWIALGAPASSQNPDNARLGWFADEVRPTLYVKAEPGLCGGWTIKIGAFDYYSGLQWVSMTSDVEVSGRSPGSELLDLLVYDPANYRWIGDVSTPLVGEATFNVLAQDAYGNITVVSRTVVGN